MESLNPNPLLFQWQRKLIALFTAIAVWLFVNHTITSTKMIPGVPVRIVNLPVNKTVQGLLPNAFLSRRVTLNVTGTKQVIDQLEPGDIEVLLDVSSFSNESVVQINKKNIAGLNPNINLSTAITSVTGPELVIKLSDLLTEKIPVFINPPVGSAPGGYEFLDIWPTMLMQTVTGPQEQVLQLKANGLELTINLDNITKEQLNELHAKRPDIDEVGFAVPESKKKVNIPFTAGGPVSINDSDAAFLKVYFLKQNIIPLGNAIPIHVYYPLKHADKINPETYPLEPGPYIEFKNHLAILSLPLFAKNVSKLFVNIIKDNIELDIVTAPPTERERLEWSVGFIDEAHLEDTYVAFLLSHSKFNKQDFPSATNKEREILFRNRFRRYMQRFTLYLSDRYKLEPESRLENNRVKVHFPDASLLTSPSKKDSPETETPKSLPSDS